MKVSASSYTAEGGKYKASLAAGQQNPISKLAKIGTLISQVVFLSFFHIINQKLKNIFYLSARDGPEATNSPSGEDLYEEVDEDNGFMQLEPSRRHRPESDYIYELDNVQTPNWTN